MNSLTKAFSEVKFWGKKHSPELLIASGICLALSSVVLACVATNKIRKPLEVATAKIKDTHALMNDSYKIQNGLYSVEEGRKELAKTYAKTAGKILWVYAPAILTFSLSVSCILGSHKIMKGRNIALAAAYTTLENGYKAYRNRVKEKLGEEAEDLLYKNVTKEKQETADKDGKLKSTTVNTPHLDKNSNPYSALYTCGNRGWERNAVLNYEFLMTQQSYLNRKLQAQGFLFLSDVYDALGFDASMLGADKVRASHILGWIYDLKDPTRDNYVSFGLTNPNNITKPSVQEQLESNEPSFWLEFNCDGDILNLNKDPNKKTFSNYAKDGCC